MDKLVLSDFENWKKMNKENQFSLYDYIFCVKKQKEINSDLFFAFYQLFWPPFVVHDDLVILKEHYSKTKIDNLIQGKKNVEFWMNLFLADSFFADEDNADIKSKMFAELLLKSWKIKLETEFPQVEFAFECFCDEELGDYGLTFYTATIQKE